MLPCEAGGRPSRTRGLLPRGSLKLVFSGLSDASGSTRSWHRHEGCRSVGWCTEPWAGNGPLPALGLSIFTS
jgi:hypothetical protein